MQHSEGFLAIVNDAKQRVNEVDIPAYRVMLEQRPDLLLIDTREESEWAAGHAAGAVHLSKGVIERDIERTEPSTDRTLILYCGGGYRSALAADNLQKMGYTSVYSLAGGWRAWLEAGMPVER